MNEIKNLKFSYGQNTVLDNISLALEPGRIYGLLGENGVGKTTLLTLLCGLKKPQEGSIVINGMDPYDRQPQLLEDQYYLPDEVAPVNEIASSWAKRTGAFWPKFNMDSFTELMNIFEVDPEKKMSKMSAGQLKKTYVAFALSCGARYIYMDEPTNALDIPGKAQFRSAIMKYTSEDSTIVISTHQVRDLENIIDPIVILDKNAVLLNASLEEISSKLYFDYGTQLHTESLYTEQLPGGFIQVYPNSEGVDSKVSVEALFNAAHKNKEFITNLFRK